MELGEILYSVEEVAEMTRLSERTIRNYLKDGSLKGRKIGGRWRFTGEEVMALFDRKLLNRDWRKQADEDVKNFLEGAYKAERGKTYVMAVADLWLTPAQIKRRCDEACRLFSRESKDSLSFRFVYDEKAGKGRFTMFGPPALIAKVMESLK